MSKIPHNVFVLGLVSLFNDIASEMIYPLVPIFLTVVLGVPATILGLIEGIAEATASLMKFVSGYISDLVQKRKIFVVSGYGLASISKLLIAVATSWHFVLFARFIDRLGKGLRTSARDSLLLQNATAGNKGFIFGFHRAMDSAGAVIGPLLALLLLQVVGENIRQIFFLAFIPSLVGVLLLVFFVKEKTQPSVILACPESDSGVAASDATPQNDGPSLNWSRLHPGFKSFFLLSMVFALGNSSDAFLILRAKDLGFSTSLVIVTYILYNLSQTIFSTPAGQLADKIGARHVFGIGLLVFALVYFLFGIIKNPAWIWLIFPLYGIYIAFTDGVSKAYISQLITEKESGTYFGIYQTGMALASFFASFVGGILWNRVNPSATLFYGSIMALVAFLILWWRTKISKEFSYL